MMNVDSEGINCQACGKTFLYHKNLLQHFRAKHGHVPPLRGKGKAESSSYKCDFCDHKTSSKADLDLHRKQHKTAIQPFVCPLCSPSVKFSKQELYDHFKSDHSLQLSEEKMEFPSEGEFLCWKAKIEKDSACNFSLKDKYTTIGSTVRKFHCHRDGVFKSHGENIRHLKMRGSVKVGGHCPASMRVSKFEAGNIAVRYCGTHVGHSTNEIGRMRLSLQEREEVARKIAAGIPFDLILDSVRKSISSSADLERRHLLTTKDLFNIKRDFNLQNNVVRHSNDLTSVESWIEESKQSGDIIRFYKPQGMEMPGYPELHKDVFVLIIMNEAQVEVFSEFAEKGVCMDDTHGLNPYGFLLTTILVFDNLSIGFPSAFMLSNCGTVDVMGVFIKFVREAVGFSVKPKFVMSDMADVFYNAWVLHMQPPEFRLYCSWHVDKSWRKNLTKIKGRETQAEVYKVLRTLLEAQDVRAFEEMMNASVELFLSNEDTADFGHYFNVVYAGKAPRWAYCYRKHAGVNTNMSLERFHGVLKHVYLKGNKPKRLDISLHALMRYLRDKLFDRVIHMQKGKLTHKMSAIRTRHRSALLLNKESVVNQDEGLWKCFSSDSGNTYDVSKSEKEECGCELRCDDCNICIHMFQCSCPDSSTHFNMCKHIHLVNISNVDCERVVDDIDDTAMESDHLVIDENRRADQQEGLLKCLMGPRTNRRSEEIDKEKEKKHLTDLFRTVLEKTWEPEDSALVEKTLKSLSITLDAQHQCHTSVFMKEKDTSYQG
ncbi:Zinc finger protein [Nesidiocoris tenuis]|uniref:Zinc finger protein n=1 Tax=Nesidiocoris tenuis TaxID=355587 RepID=A0ABN7BEE9_9HEMI|nr:Zinc finger protein [Nesidiocoris tenuis]